MKQKRLIATKGEWALSEVVDGNSLEWTDLHLVRLKPGARKNSWRFAWNGERLSRTRDLFLLADHHEDVLGWVYDVLDGGAA